jgi:hypothetical protein
MAIGSGLAVVTPLHKLDTDAFGRQIRHPRASWDDSVGFGLLTPEVAAFRGHAAFHRVPESLEF